jgi:hypothetical protein
VNSKLVFSVTASSPLHQFCSTEDSGDSGFNVQFGRSILGQKKHQPSARMQAHDNRISMKRTAGSSQIGVNEALHGRVLRIQPVTVEGMNFGVSH